MSNGDRIAIVVAVIGVIGVLGAALIGNWDKIFAPSPKIDSYQTAWTDCSQDGSMPPVPDAPPPGCVLIVEWWYPPNPTPCGLWITYRGVEFKEGVAGHWWYEYDSTVAAHIQAFKAKDTSKPCEVVDYR
jgi:hypothetical protein